MGRPPKYTPAQKLALGLAIVTARRHGVPWKTLERIYGHRRIWLWRLAIVDPTASELFSKHLGHGQDGAASTRISGMGGSGPSAPPPPPPTPALEDPAVQEARTKAIRDAASKAKGRAATILTGSEGDTSQPTLGVKTLLGA
jgi:hypothetical protein